MPEVTGNLSKQERIERATKERFMQFDQEKMIELFDLEHTDETITVKFLGHTYTINRANADCAREDRPADTDEMASIYEYLTLSNTTPMPTGEWKTIAALCTNTTDTSLGRYIDYLKPFEGKTDLLKEAFLKLGAHEIDGKGDLNMVLPIFDGIECYFQYWEADDEFPVSLEFLWDSCIVLHYRWSILWNVMTCVCNRLKEEAGIDALK